MCLFPFSSDSFASKVPLATWLHFGMSLASLGAVLFWFQASLLATFSFPLRSVWSVIGPSSGSFLGVFPRLKVLISDVDFPIVVFCVTALSLL